MPDSAITVKRGATPSPRHVLAQSIAHIPLRRVPAHHLFLPRRLSIWHNDYHGDCVTAEEAFAKACHNPEVFITDDEVQAWATAHGVFEGADIHQVLEWMQDDGFVQGGQKFDDGVITSVNWTSEVALRSALYHGPVKIGVAADQLETTARANNFTTGWYATGYTADANEDHCTSLCGYGTIGWLAGKLGVPVPAGASASAHAYAMFSWGAVGIIDFPSIMAITHEAWLRTPTSVITA